jgi:dUTP diphosphatase
VSDEPEKPTDFINDPTFDTLPVGGIPEPKFDHVPMAEVKIKLTHPNARVPEQGSPESAGYDLFSKREINILPGSIVHIDLGFSTEMPPTIHGRIESRSGLASRGLVVLTGVIDSDYRGEWKVIMKNFTDDVVTFEAGAKVAQVVFRPTYRASWILVPELEDSERGIGGFGSTGR